MTSEHESVLPRKRSSVIAITDGHDRYLLYHDRRWDCDFFPNLPTIGTIAEEQQALPARLASAFDLTPDMFTLEYAGETDSRKPALSHNGVTRDYTYRLWFARLTWTPVAWRMGRFKANGFDCHWATLTDMQADAKLMQVNRDVVNMVGDAK